MPESNDTSAQPVRSTSPVPVQVQCDGYRCLAYQDEKGTWRDFITGVEIKGNVQKVSYEFS